MTYHIKSTIDNCYLGRLGEDTDYQNRAIYDTYDEANRWYKFFKCVDGWQLIERNTLDIMRCELRKLEVGTPTWSELADMMPKRKYRN